MHIKLLNLGFIKKGSVYVCEDMTVEIHGDMIYICSLQQEVSYDEFERIMLLN